MDSDGRTRGHGAAQQGFTLPELVVVIVLLGVLAATAALMVNPRGGTAPYQAEKLAQNLRHAQALAMSWGTPLQLAASGTAYTVSCTAATAPPCAVSPVVDPATGSPFSVTLQDGVSFAAPVTVRFDVLGVPLDGVGNPASGPQTLQLSDGMVTASVTVTALSGFVSTTP